MGDDDVRPQLARVRVEPDHFRVRVVRGEEAEPFRNAEPVANGSRFRVGQSADQERHARRRLEVRLHGRELGGLVSCDGARADVAAERLQQRGRCADRHRDAERGAVVRVRPAAQHAERVHARHRETRRDVARQRRVQRHVQPGGAPERGQRVRVHEDAVGQGEPAGNLHPRVRRDHQHAGRHAAERDRDAGQPVRARREPVPAIQIEAEEDRLDEEGVALERERRSDHAARHRHEARPEQPQLEGERGAGHGADRERQRRRLRPLLRERAVVRAPRAQPQPLRDQHQHGHADAERGEDHVERERDFHLRPRRGQDIHLSHSWWPRASVPPARLGDKSTRRPVRDNPATCRGDADCALSGAAPRRHLHRPWMP